MEDLKVLPKHIGFIPDGNGRWATKRGLPRHMGHAAGIKSLKIVLEECFYKYNIGHVSLYAFSTENWNRPQFEINYLEKLFTKYLQSEAFIKRFPKVRLNVWGDYSKFSNKLVQNIQKTVEKTQKNNKFVLNICINYSGQDEIIRAVNNIIADKLGTFNQETGGKLVCINRKTFENYLYSMGQPPLDFVVRTSGEQRISNFMLWQMAYAELYFPKVYWPSFKSKQLSLALKEFQNRDRRFGSIKINK